MLFAIVFGLSMDYEVFLISRMHERWAHTREHSRSVAEGLALTGRVVTAAAAIMVCVFLSFMLGENRVIKEFGLSLASAVFLDALVVRCLLLPAVLHLVGERTWRIPAWLDRALPRLNIEGTVLPSDTAPESGAHAGGTGAPAPAQVPIRAPASRPREWRAEPHPSGGGPRCSPFCSAAVSLGRCTSRAPLHTRPLAQSAQNVLATPALTRTSVVLAFVPAGERELASVPGMSVGIMSATQGAYTPAQLLLDITQGARIARSAYSPTDPPAAVAAHARRRTGDDPRAGRPARRARRRRPPAAAPRPARRTDPRRRRLRGHRRRRPPRRDRRRRPHRAQWQPSRSDRPDAARPYRGCSPARTACVVADLPAGPTGLGDLRALSAARAPGELLLVVQRARAPRGHELLWAGAAGLASGAGTRRAETGPATPMSTLTSQTTNQRGLIAAVDLAPTILRHLDPTRPLPADMRGDPIHTDGTLHSAEPARPDGAPARGRPPAPARAGLAAERVGAAAARLRALAARAGMGDARGRARRAVGARRRADPRGPAAERGSRVPDDRARLPRAGRAHRPAAALAARARSPPRSSAILALAVDALAGTQLLVRSLLGPNPILGARFYGIGNELKSGLAVLVLAAVAAALYPAIRGRRAALRDGRRRRPARRRRGLRANRRRGRRRDPRRRRDAPSQRSCCSPAPSRAGAR